MKKYRIPIFTEEYAVNVVIGTREQVIKALAKYTTYSPKTIKKDFENQRGIVYNCYPDKHPIIGIDGELNAITQIATIAHEAIHAIDYLMGYIEIDAKETEFRGHGVATILRTILKHSLTKTKK
jgi:hypothetical protein